MSDPIQLHATAIRIGTTGLLLVGPSGAGKSAMALSLMAVGRRTGHAAFLVSDDLVVIEEGREGITARNPGRLTGRIELRGSGIGTVPALAETLLHWAVEPVSVTAENRIPDDGLRYAIAPGLSLPLLPVDRLSRDPFAVLEAMIPGFPGR